MDLGVNADDIRKAVDRARAKEISKAAQAAVQALITEEWLEQVRASVAESVAAIDMDGEPEMEGEPAELTYGSAAEFFQAVLYPIYHRKVSGKGDTRWAAEWWKSGEAVVRVDALWRAFEFLRLDGQTGMSVWLKDHADYHMGVLLGSAGAFATSTDQNDYGQPLPSTPPPAELFPDERDVATEDPA